jgi:hypothetical protein
MSNTEPLPDNRASRPGWQFAAGGVTAAVLLLGLAEAYLQCFPPTDLHPFLGNRSPARGILVPDEHFGARYRSWDAFHHDNRKRLDAYLPFQSGSGRPVWAMFGNSFIHAPGMLADTTRAAVKDRVIFNLGRNEPLPLRMAQVELLLEHGLRPERIFFELMPIDVVPLAEQPLATIRVNAGGALGYAPDLPPSVAGDVVSHSRVALTAWCRSGLHRGGRNYRRHPLHASVPLHLLRDLEKLFSALARVAERHDVPVTVILIPPYQQTLLGQPCGFQDAVGPVLRQQGYDVLDPREAFFRHPDRPGLYIPDRHLSSAGNRLLLDELLAHVRHEPARHARRP